VLSPPSKLILGFPSRWVLIFQLQRSERLTDLIAELDAAGKKWSTTHKGNYKDHLAAFFQSSPHVPLLTSTISETLRIASDSYSMRGVMKETVELGGYTFKKDDTILCRSRAVHLNDEEYENAKEFVPTRFMTDEGGKMTEKSSSWMPFGGGTSQCFGE
jgi:cytochrome P450